MNGKDHNLPTENNSTVKYRVLYADTDRMGVVYHGEYFKWFEAGRANYMRRRAAPYSAIEAEGIQLPVVEAHANYLKPARYDDVVQVTAWISDIGRIQLTFSYEVTLDGKVLVRGHTRHATIDQTGRPVRMPEKVRQALISEEKIQDPEL